MGDRKVVSCSQVSNVLILFVWELSSGFRGSSAWRKRKKYLLAAGFLLLGYFLLRKFLIGCSDMLLFALGACLLRSFVDHVIPRV